MSAARYCEPLESRRLMTAAGQMRELHVEHHTGTFVTGTVYNDANGNYARDAGEVGLPGWTVFIDTDDDAVLDANERRVTTNAQGRYSFSIDRGAYYNVRAVKPAGYRPTIPGLYRKHVVHVPHLADAPVDRDFGFTARGMVSGVVYRDVDGDGVRDNADIGIPDVRVYVDRNYNGQHDPGEIFTITNAAGQYFLNCPSTGTYPVRQARPSEFTPVKPLGGGHTVTLASGAHLMGRNFANKQLVRPTATVPVVFSRTRIITVDEAEPAAPTVWVTGFASRGVEPI